MSRDAWGTLMALLVVVFCVVGYLAWRSAEQDECRAHGGRVMEVNDGSLIFRGWVCSVEWELP